MKRQAPRTSPTELLKATEVAEKLLVSTSTVWRIADRGELRRVRFGPQAVRFLRADVEALIAKAVDEGPASAPGLVRIPTVTGGRDGSSD